jgi:hypothetical protein
MAATYAGQPGPLHKRQCEAKSVFSQERCKKRAIRGSNVCGTHGGQAPRAKQNAKLRLAMLVDPAIDVMMRLLKPKPGRGNQVKAEVRLAAARDILDRNGFKSRDEVVITQEFEVSRFAHLTDDELRQLVALGMKVSTSKDVHNEQPVLELLPGTPLESQNGSD